MLPKTFQVRIRLPLDQYTYTAYLLYAHAESYEEALGWVHRTFPGLSTQGTREACSDLLTQGTLTVSVTDCDKFAKLQRLEGRAQFVRCELGASRKSPREVSQSLLSTFLALQKDRLEMQERAQFLEKAHARELRRTSSAEDWFLESAAAFRALALPMLDWQENLWQEYRSLEEHHLHVKPSESKPIDREMLS